MIGLPVEKQAEAPVMWRAYTVALSTSNRLVLVGATGRKWNEAEFTATCMVGESNEAHMMRDRIARSNVFLPGQLESQRRSSDLTLAHKRCKMHLEAGTCTCGVWGYRAPARIQREYLRSEFWCGEGAFTSNLEVLCAVRIYGSIFEGVYGYRASNAEIEAMFVPGNVEIYLPLQDNMQPYLGADSLAFLYTKPSTITVKRLDPQAVWAHLSRYYSCQVIPIADGVQHIYSLDNTYPDPEYRAIVPDSN